FVNSSLKHYNDVLFTFYVFIYKLTLVYETDVQMSIALLFFEKYLCINCFNMVASGTAIIIPTIPPNSAPTMNINIIPIGWICTLLPIIYGEKKLLSTIWTKTFEIITAITSFQDVVNASNTAGIEPIIGPK